MRLKTLVIIYNISTWCWEHIHDKIQMAYKAHRQFGTNCPLQTHLFCQGESENLKPLKMVGDHQLEKNETKLASLDQTLIVADLVSQIISAHPHTTAVPGTAPISMPCWIGCRRRLLLLLLISLRGFTWSALHVLVDCLLHRNRNSWEQCWEPFQLGQEGAEHLSDGHYTPSSSLHVQLLITRDKEEKNH